MANVPDDGVTFVPDTCRPYRSRRGQIRPLRAQKRRRRAPARMVALSMLAAIQVMGRRSSKRPCAGFR